MASGIPYFDNACIAGSSNGFSVYLAGVVPELNGRLSLYNISLANIDSPQVSLINSSTNTTTQWRSSLEKACMSFPYYRSVTDSPIMIVQFGPLGSGFHTYANSSGLKDDIRTVPFNDTTLISSKLFAQTGSVSELNWMVAYTEMGNSYGFAPWLAIRYNATSGGTNTFNLVQTAALPKSPFLAVGTFTESLYPPSQGYLTVFDTASSGIIYSAINSGSGELRDSVIALANLKPVVMGGVTLTRSAVSVTMSKVGYILDSASDGSVVMYMIDPSTTSTLQRVPVTGKVPRFQSVFTAAVMNKFIITYSSPRTGSGVAQPVINRFNVALGSWEGPNLVTPPPVTTTSSVSVTPSPTSITPKAESSGSSTGAIIGGAVGGVVVLALLVFLFIRHRRKSSNKDAPAKDQYHSAATKEPETQSSQAQSPAMAHMNSQPMFISQQQQQQQQQQFQQQQQQHQPQQQYYQPQQYQLPQQYQQQQQQQQQGGLVHQMVPVSPVPSTSTSHPHHQSMIFQPSPSQQSTGYAYAPPTIIPQTSPHQQVQQQHQSVFFQPQTTTSPATSPTYTQSNQSNTTPQ
ncbi:hypothetical protein BGW38_001030 [Lunasporangiospora selenospora]|uniref:Uncharacterized protein n=1 Tax=Lunasporangiospora selenospora TaxID=979761 RepID=A0A9P6KI94_9FUNG|nr:hypothetical protein BGW38_001030 [Lunasporangiospora selenospora]